MFLSGALPLRPQDLSPCWQTGPERDGVAAPLVHTRGSAQGRGRDAHRCTPPAQIRTSGTTAYGSSLGSKRQSARQDKDEECGDEEPIARR